MWPRIVCGFIRAPFLLTSRSPAVSFPVARSTQQKPWLSTVCFMDQRWGFGGSCVAILSLAEAMILSQKRKQRGLTLASGLTQESQRDFEAICQENVEIYH